MERLHKKLADRPFAILAVNVKQPASDARRFAEVLGVTFTILLDRYGRTAKDWGVRIYPTTFLIDTEGRIRDVIRGPLEWDSDDAVDAIEALLPDGPAPSRMPEMALRAVTD